MTLWLTDINRAIYKVYLFMINVKIRIWAFEPTMYVYLYIAKKWQCNVADTPFDPLIKSTVMVVPLFIKYILSYLAGFYDGNWRRSIHNW